jgi:hypothetical protein
MIQKIIKIDQALKTVDHQLPDNEVDLFYRYALEEKWNITLTIPEDDSLRYPKLFKFLYRMIEPYLL